MLQEQDAISGKYLCEAGRSSIYSKIRTRPTKVVLAPGECLCSADIVPNACRHGLRPGFLRWCLLGDRFSTQAAAWVSERCGYAEGQPGTLVDVTIPEPPGDEQASDVWDLQERWSRLDE